MQTNKMIIGENKKNCSKVGIVVVTFNRIKLLKEVIDSLRNQNYDNYNIIVVNNGSTDGTKEWLKSQTDLIVITQENLGGSGGFFTGMKYVAEHDYDYCWIMDDDVITSTTSLSELVTAIETSEDIGFVCSRVIGIDGYPMNTPYPDFRPTSNGYSNVYDKVCPYYMVKVQNATFVSVLFKTETIREVGLPIKEYFIWGDDTEYTERISLRYACYVACKSVVTHKRARQEALSFEKESDSKRLHNYAFMFRNHLCTLKLRNQKRAYKKYFLRNVLKASKMALKGDFKHASIMLNGSLKSLSFHPEIQYPNLK